jgi:hypothetical protein
VVFSRCSLVSFALRLLGHRQKPYGAWHQISSYLLLLLPKRSFTYKERKIPDLFRHLVSLACTCCVLTVPCLGQAAHVHPIRMPAGSLLTFHLQSRLNPKVGNQIDSLPRGTTLQVKLLDDIDSNSAQDGSEFRGELISSLDSPNATLVHAQSTAHILLVLLRNRTHPQGFRYELLVTGLNDHGRSFDLTASLNPSITDEQASPGPAPGLYKSMPTYTDSGAAHPDQKR